MSDKPLGRFCWYELMIPDPAAAPAFYGAIAGWTTQSMDMPGKPYTMWVNGEQPIGGVMELPEEAKAAGAPPHWLAHISTPNIGETVAKATELGATILMGPMEVPTVGTFAIIADPQGAVFSAYEAAGDAPGHDGPPKVGEFSWHELMTSDLDGAFAFYSGLFGWEKTVAMEMGEMGLYQMYSRGAHELGGMMKRPPQMPVSSWLFYIRVPDAVAATETVKALGGKVMSGPMQVPGPSGDMVAQCFDPAGAMFAVHSTPAA